ncbi:MarR family winged helix-turn-helix transcriptional regulator [Frateuria aurantia]
MCSDETLEKVPDSFGAVIAQVRCELIRALEREFQANDIGVRFTSYLLLKKLVALGPLTAGELAQAIDLDAGALTRQLDQLEKKGLLRRVRHEQDRRALRIEATPAGLALNHKSLLHADRVLAKALKALQPDEVGLLNDYLRRVLDALRSSMS